MVCGAKLVGGWAAGTTFWTSELYWRASVHADEVAFREDPNDCKVTTAEWSDAPAVPFGGTGIPDETPIATVVYSTGHY